ncbi:hypothetical protein Y032_0243g3482 [Ancylostoma ceylanicum]|nr:hypothetical protein Y032_0243g3482 [Ancylostoma ceylanicum]
MSSEHVQVTETAQAGVEIRKVNGHNGVNGNTFADKRESWYLVKGSIHGKPHFRGESFSVWSAASQSQW